MKAIDIYINEKLKINKDTNKIEYHYHPKSKSELITLLLELLEKRGSNADLNDIDVSKITDFISLFYEVNRVPGIDHIDISKWDVSNVTNMNSMFYKCYGFNCDLSNWDVSNVNDMRHMFEYCNSVNFDIEKWNVKETVKAKDMFHGTVKLEIPSWWYKLSEQNK